MVGFIAPFSLFQSEGAYQLCLTELRRNQVYVMVYHHWCKFLLVEFTPYVLMIVLNCLIWRRVRAMVRMRYEVGLAAGRWQCVWGGRQGHVCGTSCPSPEFLCRQLQKSGLRIQESQN